MANIKLLSQQDLLAQIEEWNTNRLDLFTLSIPNQDLEFFGVMRFYYQDEGEKVSTKCIRVSSTARASDVLATLIEKFRPDMKMLTRAKYALYEVYSNGEERKLNENEFPLLVQLSWNIDDRDGRFLLKKETDKTRLGSFGLEKKGLNSDAADDSTTFKRKLSRREKKELKKKEKEERMYSLRISQNNISEIGVAKALYSEVPESSFTRSISNPDLVLKKRREIKFNKKLQESDGTLKIYGGSISPDVPYKTIMVKLNSTAAQVVADTLIKYGLEKENPENFCLVQSLIVPENAQSKEPRERILEDDEFPFSILLQHPTSKGTLVYSLRPRPSDAIRRRSRSSSVQRESYIDPKITDNRNSVITPMLVYINQDGQEGQHYKIEMHETEIGKMPYTNQFIQINGPEILERHCVISRTSNSISLKPLSLEATVFLNNVPVQKSTLLNNGDLLQFGRMLCFRYIDSKFEDRVITGRAGKELSFHSGGSSKDFETTFDVDGHIETMLHTDLNLNKNGLGQQFIDLLPITLAFKDSGENELLNACMTKLEEINLPFKPLPAYLCYLIIRSRILTISKLDHNLVVDQQYQLEILLTQIAQRINQNIVNKKDTPPLLVFWMANASELLTFIKRDVNLANNFKKVEEMLTEAVYTCFAMLLDYLCSEMQLILPAFISHETTMDTEIKEYSGENNLPPTIGNILYVLSHSMHIIRGCRVHPGLTIHVFSHIFHFIGAWLCNRILIDLRTQLVTVAWGKRLRSNLKYIFDWAENLGLEVAAEYHLSRCLQITHLLETISTYTLASSELDQIFGTYSLLNSIQLHALLTAYANNSVNPPFNTEFANALINVARMNVDKGLESEGIEIKLDEQMSLPLTFILPDDGYTMENLKGVPSGTLEFLAPLEKINHVQIRMNPNASGLWIVYFIGFEQMRISDKNLNDKNITVPNNSSRPPIPQQVNNDGQQQMYGVIKSSNKQSPHQPGFKLNQNLMQPNQQPQIVQIIFNKINNSLGLSIVSTMGENQTENAIYIKSVVDSGAAAQDGRLMAGDQIVEVDGKSLIGISQEKAAEMMSKTGQTVKLLVAKQAAAYHGITALLAQASPPVNSYSKLNDLTKKSGNNTEDPIYAHPRQPSLDGYRNITNNNHGINYNRREDSASMISDSYSDPIYYSQNQNNKPPLVNQKITQNGKILEKFLPHNQLINNEFSQSNNNIQNNSSAFDYNAKNALPNFNQKVEEHNTVLRESTASPKMMDHNTKQLTQQNLGYAAQILFNKFDSQVTQKQQTQISSMQKMAIQPSNVRSPLQSPSMQRLALQQSYQGVPPFQQSYHYTASQQPQRPLDQQQSNLNPSNIGPQSAYNHIPNENISSQFDNSRISQNKNDRNSQKYEFDFPPPPPDLNDLQQKVSYIQIDAKNNIYNGNENPTEKYRIDIPNINKSFNEIKINTTQPRKPPPVAVKPKINSSDFKASGSAWGKEEKEKEEDDERTRKRCDEIQKLQSRPYLSRDEQTKLSKLMTEQEFEERVKQRINEGIDDNDSLSGTPIHLKSQPFYNLNTLNQSNSIHTIVHPQYANKNNDNNYDPTFNNMSPNSKQFQMNQMKKSVTFNENIGVNEYPTHRSFGSTSSDTLLLNQHARILAQAPPVEPIYAPTRFPALQISEKLESQNEITIKPAYQYKPYDTPSINAHTISKKPAYQDVNYNIYASNQQQIAPQYNNLTNAQQNILQQYNAPIKTENNIHQPYEQKNNLQFGRYQQSNQYYSDQR